MHRLFILFVIVFLIGGGYWYYTSHKEILENKYLQTIQQVEQNTSTPEVNNASDVPQNNDAEKVKVVAQNLDTPWAIAFSPNGSFFITERPGRVRRVEMHGILQDKPVASLSNVKEIGEGGLLGIALHPNFSSNNLVYLYYTYNGEEKTQNRVVRMTYNGGANTLSDEEIIVDAIPGGANHNGGRIKFGPDGYLYIGTGDAENPSQAQDTNSLAGKILRVTENGDPAPGNPFESHTLAQGLRSTGDGRVYSYGHRNVQGLAWDSTGQLWATEHGPSGGESCCDEVNRIERGGNYGWPIIQDMQTKDGMITPVKSSGKNTWAPSGLAFLDGSFYFAGLRGQTLYQAFPSGNSIPEIKEHLKGQYGRLREVILGPDNMLYITTSNKDGRGSPKSGDDKIIRVNPNKL